MLIHLLNIVDAFIVPIMLAVLALALILDFSVSLAGTDKRVVIVLAVHGGNAILNVGENSNIAGLVLGFTLGEGLQGNGVFLGFGRPLRFRHRIIDSRMLHWE